MKLDEKSTGISYTYSTRTELKHFVDGIGMSRIIIFLFFLALLLLTEHQDVPTSIGNVLMRVGINCVLVLSMVPTIRAGLGPNFGVTLGIVCGLFGALVSTEFYLAGLTGFAIAALVATVVAVPAGIAYGYFLNQVKGSEMMIATYFGNAIVSIMCIAWLILPFKSPEITWPLGGAGSGARGLRNTITLEKFFGDSLSHIFEIELFYEPGSTMDLPIGLIVAALVVGVVIWVALIKSRQIEAEDATAQQMADFKVRQAQRRKKGYLLLGVLLLVCAAVFFIRPADGVLATVRSIFVTTITFTRPTSLYVPTGTILFGLLCCLVIWVFLQTRTGVAMSAAGANPDFARANGISVNKMRILGAAISAALAAIGIIVYSQGYGFIQLYSAPIGMVFPTVAAVLLGGATTKSAKVSHVIIGTALLQGILTLGPPIASRFLSQLGGGNDPTEVVRIIITNGIILYALTKAGGGKNGK